jgi:hypothetical protein
MSIADLTRRLKEAFEEKLTSLQQDGKLYLTEEEWDARRKKRVRRRTTRQRRKRRWRRQRPWARPGSWLRWLFIKRVIEQAHW